MDRNSILSGYISNFSSYSSTDSRTTVEKVLKYSGNNFDIRKRADIKREVVVFKLQSGTTDYLLNDEKPNELTQQFQATIYIEQPDSHSLKDTVYDRALEISDQLFDWATDTTASDINSDLWTLTVTGVDSVEEQDGYLSTTVNFESIIQIS
jgi:hypothetical protein